MRSRWVRALGALPLATLLACGDGGKESGSGGTDADAGEPLPISGIYEVEGATVDKATSERRDISGTVVLAVSGDAYTATFHLSTTFPGSGPNPVSADVIGKGEGRVEGRELVGSAHTQLVVASVPGVDPNFAFIPRQISTRLISDSKATVGNDGSVAISIESRAEPGEDYSPTKTTLRGRRTAAVPSERRTPSAPAPAP